MGAPMACRYLVASSPRTLYVSFIGTKLAKDVLVDANLLHSPLWKAPNSQQVRLMQKPCFPEPEILFEEETKNRNTQQNFSQNLLPKQQPSASM